MKKRSINSSRTPVYRDAGFELYNAQTAASAFEGEASPEREPDLYIYSRYRNPTVVAAEEEIMKLEEASCALLTQSGMSAVDTALSIFQRGRNTGPWLFFSEIYGGTISFTDSILKAKRGLDVSSFFPAGENYDLEAFESSMKKLRPEIVYFEVISNPMLIVADALKVIKLAKKYGSIVIVDNTFATPVLFRPLEHGADIVIHSATKYFSGHGNITAGVLCGNDMELMKAGLEYRKLVGHILSPDDAYNLTTQIQTFPLRFRQQCINAEAIASLLMKSEKVSKVWYPGLRDHPSFPIAEKLFGERGRGGMVTLDFAGTGRSSKKKRRDAFISAVQDKIRLIPSLGDPKTILLPVESVWGTKYPEPGMIRLSAGFEDTAGLLKTFTDGLRSI